MGPKGLIGMLFVSLKRAVNVVKVVQTELQVPHNPLIVNMPLRLCSSGMFSKEQLTGSGRTESL